MMLNAMMLCEKTIDTSRVFEHMKDVTIALNGIDYTYNINFNHEIIPFNE